MLSSGEMASSLNISVFLKITPSAKQVNPVPIGKLLSSDGYTVCTW